MKKGGKTRSEVAVEALPLLLIVALAAFMVLREGGFAIGVWAPSSLAALALAGTVALAAGDRLRTLPTWTRVTIALLAAFTLWCFGTMVWADVPALAWTGSNLTLLYFVVFATLAAWPVSSRVAWPVLLIAGVAVSAEGAITVERLARSTDPSSFLIGTRLSAPLGYPNATAALFATMMWLLIGLASRRWLPAAARAVAMGCASLLLTLDLLAASRGSIYTLPIVAAIYLAVVPGRLRSLVTIGLVAAGELLVIEPIRSVYGSTPEAVGGLMQSALTAGIVAGVGVGLSGLVVALADDRWHPSAGAVRRAQLIVVAVAIGSVAVVAVQTTPWSRAGTWWHSFKYGAEPAGTRFGGLGSNRYDFYRVGMVEFVRHPVVGIGVDNFLVPYLKERRSDEQPLYPHSLAVRLLSQTGIVGTALFTGFLASVLLAVRRIRSRRRAELAAVLVAAASVWFVHGLVDWLWEMPVLGVVAMALLGTACALAPRGDARIVSRRSRVVWRAAGIVAAAFAVASVAPPWLAQRSIDSAASGWQENPEAAFTLLDHARALNPLDAQPDIVGGAIASRLHRYDAMRTWFADAVSRTPNDWYANLELAVAESQMGQSAAAVLSSRRAVELNPRSAIAQQVAAQAAVGMRIDSDAIDLAIASEP